MLFSSKKIIQVRNKTVATIHLFLANFKTPLLKFNLFIDAKIAVTKLEFSIVKKKGAEINQHPFINKL